MEAVKNTLLNYMAYASGWSMGTLAIVVTFGLAFICSFGLFAIADHIWYEKTSFERHLKKEALLWSLGTAVLVNIVALWLPALVGWIVYLVLSVFYVFLFLTGIELNVLKAEASQLNDDPLQRGLAFLSGLFAYSFPMFILSILDESGVGTKGKITIAVVVVMTILIGIKVTIVSVDFERRFGEKPKPKRRVTLKESVKDQFHPNTQTQGGATK